MAIQPHLGLGEMLQRIAHNFIMGCAMFDPFRVALHNKQQAESIAQLPRFGKLSVTTAE